MTGSTLVRSFGAWKPCTRVIPTSSAIHLQNIRKAAAAAKSAKALFRFPDFNPMNSSSKKKQGADEKWCVTTEKLKNHSKNNGDFTGKSRHNQSQISLADLKQVIEQVKVHILKKDLQRDDVAHTPLLTNTAPLTTQTNIHASGTG